MSVSGAQTISRMYNVASSPVGLTRRSIRKSSSSSSSSSSTTLLMRRSRFAVVAVAKVAHPRKRRERFEGLLEGSRSVSITSAPQQQRLRLSRRTPLVKTCAEAVGSGGDYAAVIYRFDTDDGDAEASPPPPPTPPPPTPPTLVASKVNGAFSQKSEDAGAQPDAADSIVDSILFTIADTDSGSKVTDEEREATDAKIAQLEAVGATQVPAALDNPLIFGDYDVSYVSTGKKQIGNPAGGRYRSGLGALLFRTVGLEQNLYEPNVVVNRIAFLIFGLVPGEVVLNGTFAAMTEELADSVGAAEGARTAVQGKSESGKGGDESGTDDEDSVDSNAAASASAAASTHASTKGYGVDDGMTVRAFFDPPRLTVGGLPTLQFGPKSSVVLSTTYLDERVRLGKGSRGSIFVFTRKSAEQAERDRKRWRVGGLAVTTLLACTVTLFVFAVRRFRAGGVTELSVATAVAVVVSFAMALVMRQGGIIAEDADYDEKYEGSVAAAAAAAATTATTAAATSSSSSSSSPSPSPSSSPSSS